MTVSGFASTCCDVKGATFDSALGGLLIARALSAGVDTGFPVF